MNNPVLLTGLPRSGTTLVVKLLNDIPNVVALNEPMPVMEMAGLGQSELYNWIDQYTAKSVEMLLTEKKAQTKHIGGAFTDNSFNAAADEQGLRSSRVMLGMIEITRELNNEFTLAIKHNGAFTAVAHHLVNRYRCFAVIRNPLSVLLSWQTVNIPVNMGRMPVAEAVDPNLRKCLDEIGDTLDRQIFIVNWFFERFQKYFAGDHILRYENLVSTGGRCLDKIIPNTEIVPNRLTSKNTNKIYKRDMTDMIAERLMSTGGAFIQFYDAADIELIQSELNNFAG
jgi:hypothetical protein